jgi:hypothetical protein
MDEHAQTRLLLKEQNLQLAAQLSAVKEELAQAEERVQAAQHESASHVELLTLVVRCALSWVATLASRVCVCVPSTRSAGCAAWVITRCSGVPLSVWRGLTPPFVSCIRDAVSGVR